MFSSSLREREFILECILLYKDLPALRKLSSKDYRDKNKKNEAYDVLVKKFKEQYPDVTKDDVKKKINSLRTNFRKELIKINKASFMGETYRPTLWYYDEFKFLVEEAEKVKNFDGSTSSQLWEAETLLSTDNIAATRQLGDDADESEPLSDFSNAVNSPKISFASSSITLPESTSTLNQVRKRKLSDDIHEESTYKCKCQKNRNQDEYDAITLIWANDLRKMDPKQAIFARKAINDVLMEGLMGTLYRNSVKVNEPSETIP